jgi:hypothetical protein
MNWWWLSFCDLDKPEGERFLGVVIIQGTDLVNAAARAARKELNPGGEIKGAPIPVDLPTAFTAEFCERLLNKFEAKRADHALRSVFFPN